MLKSHNTPGFFNGLLKGGAKRLHSIGPSADVPHGT